MNVNELLEKWMEQEVEHRVSLQLEPVVALMMRYSSEEIRATFCQTFDQIRAQITSSIREAVQQEFQTRLAKIFYPPTP